MELHIQKFYPKLDNEKEINLVFERWFYSPGGYIMNFELSSKDFGTIRCFFGNKIDMENKTYFFYSVTCQPPQTPKSIKEKAELQTPIAYTATDIGQLYSCSRLTECGHIVIKIVKR
jgi:hypothetical protein